MFYRCSSLKELNLSNINTNNVTNMEYTFYRCLSLEKLNLHYFYTNNLSNMSMFYGYSSLSQLNLPNFNTNNVSNMRSMFYGCSANIKNNIRNQYKNIKEEAFHNY